MQIIRLISILMLAASLITISLTTSSLLLVISIIASTIAGGLWMWATVMDGEQECDREV